MNYGIELEFFIKKDNQIVPAYKATSNLDGDPVIGELKTKVHNNLIDCVFELKKLIYLEKLNLNDKGFEMCLIPDVKVEDSFITELRKCPKYINNKELETLKCYSIYGGNTGKVLPRKVYKASLQINFSDNQEFTYEKYDKVEVEDKYKYEKNYTSKSYSSLFDYVSLIRNLDLVFKDDIKSTKRVKGVFAIKDGELGSRIEYRSLPNIIDLNKLIENML